MTDRLTDAREVEQLVLDAWDYADPAATAERFRVAADEAPDPEQSAVLRTQQARATGLAGDFEAAARILDEIESSGLDETATHARARLAIERGRVLNSTGDAAGAAPYFADAHRSARDAGVGGLAIDALHMQAIAASATAGPDAARAIDERALAEVEASDDPQVRRWLGSVLNNLGWDLHDSGHPDEALAVFERAVMVRAEADDHSAWVVARWCVGRTLRTLGRYDEALALMRELATDPVGAEDDYVREEIAENLAALGAATDPVGSD
jgi:ATP/maltotriose-dependent transcriptional regulator MalT